MDGSSRVRPADSGTGAARTPAEIEAQRERLRADLVAAADDEAAAVIEQARRDVTVTIRRAHRDLLLIRAQLRLCGIEPQNKLLTDLDPSTLMREATSESLGAAAPAEPLPEQAEALEHFVPESLVEREEEPTSVLVEPQIAVQSPPRPARPTVRRLASVPLVLTALLAAAAIAWIYSDRKAESARRVTDGAIVSSGRPPVDSPVTPAPASSDSAGSQTTPAASAPPRIVLRVLRPVWLRLNVDDSGDVGQLYPAGATKELNPNRALVIRAGDAGAVEMSVDGGPMRPLGEAGQVLTRRIAVGEQPAPTRVDQPVATPPISTATPKATEAPADRIAPEPPPPTVSAPIIPPPERPAPNPPAQPATSPAQAEILAGHSQWVQAYANGDQRAIAALTVEGFSMRDDRAGGGNRPGGVTPAQLSDIRVDLAGTGAVLTARVRASVDGVPSEALLSEVWVRRDEKWGLMGVRITPVENVPRPAR